MTDEDLKAIWKASNDRTQQQINLSSIKLISMNQTIKKFEQRINKRNNREIAVAMCSIGVFMIFAYIEPSLMAKIGATLLILYAGNVIYQLRKTESKQPTFDVTRSLKRQLTDYQSYIKEERKLLKNVAYWYLLPMFPGMILLLIGIGKTPTYITINFVIVAILFFGIYRLNQKAVRVNMNPLIEDIDRALKALKEEN